MGVEAAVPNRVLAGRYRLEIRLGAGGMGTIWRAEHLVLQAPVAVKLIDREAVPDEDTVARFLREAKAAAALRSPHVVQIIDYGVDELIPFMVMELLEGENLAQRLKRIRRLSRQDTARILTHVGRAMQRAHEAGVVHRDLKPDNVFIVKNGDEELAKVLDFGVAKVQEAAFGPESTRTRTGSILGTPFYMSPEQAQGNKAVDYRTDLWALGVIAFECLTGKRPFYSDGLGDLVLTICVRDLPIPSDIAPVPLGFDAWFAQACARDPEARFQSAREMTEALRDALGLEKDPLPDAPEIVVGGASSGPPPENSDAVTVASDSHRLLAGGRGSPRPDSDAPTVVAHASEPPPRSADAGGPAPTEALFSTTQHEPPLPPSKRSMTAVYVVAMLAMSAGLIGGLVYMKSPSRDLERQRAMELPDPAAPPLSTVVAAPPKKLETAEAPSAPKEEEDELEPLASASASAAPPASAGLAPASSAGALSQPDAAAPRDADTTADGGWQKPDWAIPDDEIPIRRGPDVPEEKIVIPQDTPAH